MKVTEEIRGRRATWNPPTGMVTLKAATLETVVLRLDDADNPEAWMELTLTRDILTRLRGMCDMAAGYEAVNDDEDEMTWEDLEAVWTLSQGWRHA